MERTSSLKKRGLDIRVKYSWPEREISHVLQRTGPACPVDSGARLSGIACLTMVIRVIISYLGKAHWDRDSERADQEDLNPFMRFSWLTFCSTIFEDQEIAVKELVAAFWGLSMDQLVDAGRAGELTFEFLVNSGKMMDTIWSWPELRAFGHFHWTPANSNRLLEYDPVTAPQSLRLQLQSFYPVQLPSAMKVMLHPDTDLSDEVNKFYDATLLRPDNITVIARPALPPFLFLTCEIAGLNPGDSRLSIETVRALHIDERAFVEESGWVYTSTGLEKRYVLVALVKYRDGLAQSDYIRIYDRLGRHIRMTSSADTVAGYSTDDWTIGDIPAGGTLFLLYAENVGYPYPALEKYSEVAPREMGGGVENAAI